MSEARAFEQGTGRTRTVKVIPARIRTLPGMPTLAIQKKHVAAYARVSTNSEEQLTSYEAQVKHYAEYIQSKEYTDHWQFVDVYTDRGITGVSTAKREGFNRMIQDALAGKIEIKTAKLIQFDFSQCRNVLRGKLLGPRGKFGEMRGKLLREG